MSRIERENTSWIYGRKSEDPLLYAFENRHTIDPRFNMQRNRILGRNLALAEQKQLLKEQSSGYQVAYFHVPYCVTRYSFCRFFENFGHDQSIVDFYVDHLIRDVELTPKTLDNDIKPISAIYFGGGTPSILSPKNIEEVFNAIRNNLPITDDCEITFEARVKAIEEGKIEACLENGVNRFSFGIQSFDTKVRKLMSRFLSRDEALKQLSSLAARNLATISIDLIFGLPNQDETIWLQDLRDTLDSGVDGVDTYQLEDTMLRVRFGKNFDRLLLPSMSEKARMYRLANTAFEDGGFQRKNNTHWARNDTERNLYTSLTRSGVGVPQNDTLAFGSGAIGKAGHYRYQVDRSLDAYFERIQKGEKPIEFFEHQDGSFFLDELTAQIDYGEIHLDIFFDEYGINIEERYRSLISAYIENGLLQKEGQLLRLTEAGRFWKSNLALAFILNR